MVTRIQVISRTFFLFAGLAILMQRSNLSPATAGLVIVYSMEVAFDAVFLLMAITGLSGLAVSLERLSEYTKLPQEVCVSFPKINYTFQ